MCDIISPLKPFEPLLMSDCDCLKSISNNEKHCMLFEKRNINDLENKIVDIMNNGYDKNLLENGYKFIINERNWIIQGNKYINFLNSLE